MLDQLLSLHRVPLFRDLTLDQLQALSPLLEHREYLAGEQIVLRGLGTWGVYLLAAGDSVRFVRERPE